MSNTANRVECCKKIDMLMTDIRENRFALELALEIAPVTTCSYSLSIFCISVHYFLYIDINITNMMMPSFADSVILDIRICW